MPKSNKTSSHKMENNPSQDEASTHEESSSEQENDQKSILIKLMHSMLLQACLCLILRVPR